MATYFAPAERADKNELLTSIEIANNNSVMSGLLHSIGGLLAILNEHRQIISINDSFLKMLGIHDPSEALGLRLGEALQCIHAQEEPAGCGTTKFCSTCGAAIAIVTSLGQHKSVEKICALTANRGGEDIDISLMVKSHPIKIDGVEFLLLFLQDISLQQQRAGLERTFFHDFNNRLCALVGATEMLALENRDSNLVTIIRQSSLLLKKEVEIQRYLLQSESCTYHPVLQKTTTGQIVEELQSFFLNHPVARNKTIQFPAAYPDLSLETDMSLVLRVLCNMITNALEATRENGTVKVWIEEKDGLLSFSVWNSKAIPQDITRRIFQRNFSTKEGAGRGVGTYSMKLFGEQILGGQISFTTSEEDGTAFRFSLP
ncbi:MAG: sensor histidine kinase [Proteobacteria bacterium]|nr:sensor histidine kinase [Pseudomonadota bacterium]